MAGIDGGVGVGGESIPNKTGSISSSGVELVVADGEEAEEP